MMTTPHPLRPGLTAIAAVLALTPIPALAQAVDAGTDSGATAPAAASPTPEASAPAPQPVAPVLTLAPPAPTIADTSSTQASPEESAPAPRAAPARVKQTDVSRVSSASRATAPSPRAQVATTAPVAKAPTPVAKAPMAPAPEVADVAAPAPVAAPSVAMTNTAPPPAVSPAPATPASAPTSNEMLAIEGAGGLAVLALIGGTFALGRRRKRSEAFELADDDTVLRAEHALADAPAQQTVAAEPARMATPVAAMATAETTALPAGFDATRYSPRVQAAYRGPTPDNPSHSLQRRLRRARFFDQRERREKMSAGRWTRDEAARPTAASVNRDEQLVFRPGRIRPGVGSGARQQGWTA